MPFGHIRLRKVLSRFAPTAMDASAAQSSSPRLRPGLASVKAQSGSAVRWIEDARKQEAQWKPGQDWLKWNQWLTLKLLRQEATLLIYGRTLPIFP
jgi:hypothetical protein